MFGLLPGLFLLYQIGLEGLMKAFHQITDAVLSFVLSGLLLIGIGLI